MGGFDDILGSSPGFGDILSGAPVSPEERLRRMRERFPGAMPALGEDEEWEGFFPAARDRALAAWKSSYVGLGDLATRSRMMPSAGPLKDAAEQAEEGRKREMDEFAEASTRAGLPPVATALADTALEAVDPADLLGGAAGSIAPAARLLRRTPRAIEAVAPAAKAIPDDLSELARKSLAIGEDVPIPRPRPTGPDPGTVDPHLFPSAPLRADPVIRPPEAPFQFNTAKLDVPDDVRSGLADVINANIDDIQRQRRGVIHMDDLPSAEELAAKLGLTPENFLKSRPGKTWNVEEGKILNAVLGNSLRKWDAAGKALAAGTDDTASKLAYLAAESEALGLLKASAGASAEAGRYLRYQQELTAAFDAPIATKAALLKKYGDKLDEGKLKALAALDPENPEELAAFLRSVDKPKLREYVTDWFYSSIFSRPASHARNMLGNATMQFLEGGVLAARVPVDMAFAKAFNRERYFYASEAPQAIVGMFRGVPDGLEKGWEMMKRGYDLPLTGATATKNVPMRVSAFARSENAAVRSFGKVYTIPLRALAAEDQLFKATARGMSLHAGAARRASKEGLAGAEWHSRVAELLATPLDEMVEEAARDAARLTLVDEMSPFGKAVLGLRKHIPGVGEMLMPVVQTADRLIARGFELTPLGLIKAHKAGWRTAEAADLTTRAALGTLPMLALFGYAMDGRVTGAVPSDAAERDAFFRQGKQPWAVRMGDQWVPFGQLDPIAVPLQVVSSIAEAWKAGRTSEAPVQTTLTMAAIHLGNALLDRSYLSGPADIFEALGRGRRDEGSSIERASRRTATALAVPWSGAMRAGAEAIDPQLVATESIGDEIQAAIPGLRGNLPSRVGATGEEIVPVGGRARGFLPTYTPVVPTRATESTVERELERLDYQVGLVGHALLGEKLTADQRHRYQRIAGQEVFDAIDKLVADPWYAMQNDDVRRKALEHLERLVRGGASTTIKDEVSAQKVAIGGSWP